MALANYGKRCTGCRACVRDERQTFSSICACLHDRVASGADAQAKVMTECTGDATPAISALREQIAGPLFIDTSGHVIETTDTSEQVDENSYVLAIEFPVRSVVGFRGSHLRITGGSHGTWDYLVDHPILAQLAGIPHKLHNRLQTIQFPPKSAPWPALPSPAW